MFDRSDLPRLRENPAEWRRRGLTPPIDLQRMVDARLNGTAAAAPVREVAYADFFSA